MPNIKFYVSTGVVGSKRTGSVHIDDEEWDEMDEESRNKLADELHEEWLWNAIDTDWKVEE